MMTSLWIIAGLLVSAGLYVGWKKFWVWFSDRWDADEDERHDAIIQGKKDDRPAGGKKTE
jgi:hypothetical protein